MADTASALSASKVNRPPRSSSDLGSDARGKPLSRAGRGAQAQARGMPSGLWEGVDLEERVRRAKVNAVRARAAAAAGTGIPRRAASRDAVTGIRDRETGSAPAVSRGTSDSSDVGSCGTNGPVVEQHSLNESPARTAAVESTPSQKAAEVRESRTGVGGDGSLLSPPSPPTPPPPPPPRWKLKDGSARPTYFRAWVPPPPSGEVRVRRPLGQEGAINGIGALGTSKRGVSTAGSEVASTPGGAGAGASGQVPDAAAALGKKAPRLRWEPKYLTVKAVFFLFYSSLGAIMPYLPVYYHSLGIPDR